MEEEDRQGPLLVEVGVHFANLVDHIEITQRAIWPSSLASRSSQDTSGRFMSFASR